VGEAGDVPLLLYTTESLPSVPAGAFGSTDRPDELLHLVIDALERHRLPTVRGSVTAPLSANGHRLRRLVHRVRPAQHAS
jgi:hypothetical protein